MGRVIVEVRGLAAVALRRKSTEPPSPSGAGLFACGI